MAGQEYTHDYTLSFGNTIKDKDNINLIVYLVNTETGVIENAFTIKARDLAGIHDVVDAVAFQDGHIDYDELDAFFADKFDF